jgi:ankyrin repeat protein
MVPCLNRLGSLSPYRAAMLLVVVLITLTAITIMYWRCRNDVSRGINSAILGHDLNKIKELVHHNPNLVFKRDQSLVVPRGLNTTPSDDTLLDLAVASGERDIAEFLLANKADVNARDNYGFTPLHFAVGSRDVTELLLANGADVNAKDNSGITPLDGAMNKDVAELLLLKGADVNAKSNNGWTPLQWAEFSGRKEVVELLSAKMQKSGS